MCIAPGRVRGRGAQFLAQVFVEAEAVNGAPPGSRIIRRQQQRCLAIAITSDQAGKSEAMMAQPAAMYSKSFNGDTKWAKCVV